MSSAFTVREVTTTGGCSFCCSYVKRLRESLTGWARAGGARCGGRGGAEAADGFAGGLAFGAFASDVVLGFRVAAGACDRDAMDGGIDLSVAAAVESVAVCLAGADRDRCEAGRARELGVGFEASRAGDLADELGGGQRSDAGLVEQLWRNVGDEAAAISFSSALIVRESSQMRRSSSRATRTRIVCSARASLRAMRPLHRP